MGRFAIGLVLALVITAAPQDQRSTFRTEANYVRVDVFPTANGVPVADLRQDEFEVLEDKVPQKIASFEHVVIQGNVPVDQQRDPPSLAASTAMMKSGRGRVFVLFLDFDHVEALITQRVRQPLIDVLDRALGADDLIAVMTPRMSPSDLSFTPKHSTVEAALSQVWGERDLIIPSDPVDDLYAACYPSYPTTPNCRSSVGVAQEMIERRHEQRTLSALRDLVDYLRTARDERKAVLVVTDGWRLFSPNADLTHDIDCQPPNPRGPGLGVDPRTGKPTAGLTDAQDLPRYQCDRDRARLAQVDDATEARELVQAANRSNVSFYPIDPRGLTAYDDKNPASLPLVPTILSPEPRIDPREDVARQTARLQGLRALAEGTDGLAIVQTNGLAAGLRRITDDLSSYYLLGYTSTGKLDGKFHSITVRVKRPGVQVRARSGYLAARAADAPPAVAPDAASAVLAAEAAVVAAALSPLGTYSRELPIRLQTAVAPTSEPGPSIWVTGEISARNDWRGGGDADVLLVGADRATRASEHVQIPAGIYSFRVRLVPTAPLDPGDYSIVVRARASAASAIPSTDSVRVTIGAGSDVSGALFVRRGITTGNRDTPAADARFRRNEQLRVEVPTRDGMMRASARLLDRTGKAMTAIPVTAAMRQDADGSHWQTAQLTLVPLANGDYLIELTGQGAGGETKRTLVAFRVVP